MTERFDPDWLALREGFDARARSLALIDRLLGALPARPRLLDLGAGTGSLFRFLAPLIGGVQAWTFADADAELLDEAFRAITQWAEALDWTVTCSGRALLVHTPMGVWRVEGIALDLGDAPESLPLAPTDAILCTALLDLVSANWLNRFAAALRSPFLAGLNVDGRNVWLPHHPADAIVAAGFRRDQGRDKGFGPALGVRAPSVALHSLATHGFAVVSAPADWRVPRPALRMTQALVHGAANAARRAMPARHDAVAAWEAARMRQAAQGRLAIRVGHRDILAMPGRSR